VPQRESQTLLPRVCKNEIALRETEICKSNKKLSEFPASSSAAGSSNAELSPVRKTAGPTARNSLAPETTRIWREQNARGINPPERRENTGKTSNAKRGRKVLEENKCSSKGSIKAPSSSLRKSETEKTSAAQGSHRVTRETTKLLFQQNPGTKHTSRTPDSAPNALEEAAFK